MNLMGVFSKLLIKDDGDLYLMFCDPFQTKIEILPKLIQYEGYRDS